MADMTITLSGPAANIVNEGLDPIVKAVAEKFAASIKQHITDEISRSVQLSSFVNEHSDPEAIRTILRSVNVNVSPTMPPTIEANIKDELGHWYGGIPEEVTETLQKMLDDVISRWSNSTEPSNLFAEAMMGSQ